MHALMRLKKVQICLKNMHLIFFNAKMFIKKDILLNILSG
jgi:hypothetical protein